MAIPIASAVSPATQVRNPRRRAAGISRRLSSNRMAATGMKSSVYDAQLKTVSAYAVQGIPGYAAPARSGAQSQAIASKQSGQSQRSHRHRRPGFLTAAVTVPGTQSSGGAAETT